jgi:hypothetical protein
MPGLSPVLLHFRWQLHSIGKHGGGGKPQLDLKPIKSPHPAKKGIALSGDSFQVIRRQRLLAHHWTTSAPVHCGKMLLFMSFQGQNENPPFSSLRQLPPGADIAAHALM